MGPPDGIQSLIGRSLLRNTRRQASAAPVLETLRIDPGQGAWAWPGSEEEGLG